MKIGVLGGTFDPVHIGHLLAAECAREEFRLDEVWFMPAYAAPHKANPPTASPFQRLRMLELATASHPGFRVSRLEVDRGGVSYTYETVRELKRLYPDGEFYWIVGADMVADLARWSRIEELVGEIRFIGLSRPGYGWKSADLPAHVAAAVAEAEMPAIGVSSTEIRRLLASGRSARYLVPEPVLDYIREQKLYVD